MEISSMTYNFRCRQIKNFTSSWKPFFDTYDEHQNVCHYQSNISLRFPCHCRVSEGIYCVPFYTECISLWTLFKRSQIILYASPPNFGNWIGVFSHKQLCISGFEAFSAWSLIDTLCPHNTYWDIFPETSLLLYKNFTYVSNTLKFNPMVYRNFTYVCYTLRFNPHLSVVTWKNVNKDRNKIRISRNTGMSQRSFLKCVPVHGMHADKSVVEPFFLVQQTLKFNYCHIWSITGGLIQYKGVQLPVKEITL